MKQRTQAEEDVRLLRMFNEVCRLSELKTQRQARKAALEAAKAITKAKEK